MLVVQDLFAILALTALITFARVGGLVAGELLATLGRLGLFLVVVLGLGRFVIPRLFRWVADHTHAETLLVAMIGAIVLTLRHKQGVKRQDIATQVARTPATAIEVRKVKPGQGI